jgi:hypothetical protein
LQMLILSARRRLQPTSYIKAKLPLCTLGYAERKIPSGENQNRYLMLFDDRHGFPALQAGAKPEFFLYMQRRIQPAPGEWGRGWSTPTTPCAAHARRDAMHCVSTQPANRDARPQHPAVLCSPCERGGRTLRPAEFAIRQS